jgi:hypothetical protein
VTNFVPITIPAGVVAQPTKNMRSSNWAEVNLMRWLEGELTPIGGQQQYTYSFASRCKAIHGWYDLSGVYHLAYVCEQNVYIDTAGTLTEITPVGGWPAPPLPSEGGYGDLDYSDDNYGTPRASGQILTIDKIPNVWSVDNFGAMLVVMYSVDGRLLQWDPAATADANDVQSLTLIGAPTGGTFTLTFGNQTTGSIAYNATAANVQSALEALTSIGSGNVICTGGPLPNAITITFQGTLGNSPQPTLAGSNNNLTGGTGPAPNIAHTTNGTALVLTPVGGAPKGRCVTITQERFCMIFGMYDDGTLNADGSIDGGSFRRFGWCDQEDITAWNFTTITSQAGFLDIEPASPIITAISGRFGTIFFTAKKVYLSTYLGLPYIYNAMELADDCTPWSPASITTTSSYILWMSQQGMFSFDGTAITPVACLVRPYVTNDYDPTNVREQACAAHLGIMNEFWWFYPQLGQPYNTRCIIYNYKEGWWSMGQMSRSAGVTSSYTVQPIFADGTVAFQHELGPVYGNADPPWAETFDLNLTNGSKLVTLKQVVPDIRIIEQRTVTGVTSTDPGVQFQFYARMSRSTGPPGVWGPPVQLRPDGFVDARVTGRDIRIKISMIGPAILPFTVGQHLVDYAVRGNR